MYRFTHAHDPLLGPPAHVLAEVDAAWERAQDLFARRARAALRAGPVGGRVRASCAWPTASLVERLSATEALALACGDAALALAA